MKKSKFSQLSLASFFFFFCIEANKVRFPGLSFSADGSID
jgi:hypothetical protein